MSVISCLFFVGSIIVALAQAFGTQPSGHWGHRYDNWFVGGTIVSIIASIAAITLSFSFEMRSHRQMATLTRSNWIGLVKPSRLLDHSLRWLTAYGELAMVRWGCLLVHGVAGGGRRPWGCGSSLRISVHTVS
jgi:hypothetical protein